MYCVTPGVATLPPWTEQLASFDREHISRHEDRAPGLLKHVYERTVDTYSFSDLLTRFVPEQKIDVLQIDAEGMDSELISWFPFDKCRPAVLHYEVAHMSRAQLTSTRNKLLSYGYKIFPADGPLDDMAILL